MNISSKLKQQFDRLNIPLDARILKAIEQHHPSQVQAALNHVKQNIELIRSPRSVFLYQLPKQPIEDNLSRLPVFTAKDAVGFTLQHLKAMYPNSWEDAALHFGIPLPRS
ncbi:hypothetical protein [Myxosarcina sp. GI1]|uniref:hypothetical protein n=1 Tax=Myxosarcina sp. GI1 TaxID=1541065 RepID=UPI00068D01C6|nr:hypothetical protein [Myxosarcina sp. GI1]